MRTKLLTLVVIVLLFNEKTMSQNEKNESNPLLKEFTTPFAVPPFDKIKSEHYYPAFKYAMKKHLEEIEKIINNQEEPTFKNTVEPYFYSGELLSRISSIFFNTTSCNTNDELQKINEKISPELSAHNDAIAMNPQLFKRISIVYENRDKEKLTDEQLYLLENTYKRLVKNGAKLSDKEKEELSKINSQLAVLTVKYSKNVLDETNKFELFVEREDDLKGLPEAAIASAKELAIKKGKKDAWCFTTQKPSIIPFLQYSPNRELRNKIYKAYVNRANNNDENDNKKILSEILQLRQQKAKLLGYDDYASMRLEDRMAGSVDKVNELIEKLWKRALERAKQELEEMSRIASNEGMNSPLEASDWMYYAEKLRLQKYALDENELRPYFKLENVRDGIFAVSNKLYGLSFTKIQNIPLPHPDATAYEVKEADGKHLGVLYMDFFPRESKRGGAWCTRYRSHIVKNGKTVTPVVSIVCNFSKPSGNIPSLLSMDEVRTFFHEFGHALESLMNKATYPVAFVAQDFVELPSQIMEHWAFQKDVLKMYAKHYKTQQIIPDDLIEKINKSNYFNQGFITTEYLAAAALDIAFHSLRTNEPIQVDRFEKDYLYGTMGLINEIDPRYRSTYFTHIMGGYDAGYYSYIWSAVLDNHAFEAFEKNGIFNKDLALSFRKNILEKDGTAPPLKMYTDFRGEEPNVSALLRNRGLGE